MLPDGESNKIRIRLQPKILHDSIFVKCDRPHCNIQNSRRLLHGSALCKQLKNLTLALRQEALVAALRTAEGLAGGPAGQSVQLSNVPLGPVV